jgi:hypothetical protein
MEVDDRDIDYELAVRDSIRTEGEDAARREALEQNNKVNQELDEFLAAVEDVEDIDEPPSSGPNRKIPPPPSGKGKEPFIDISDGDDEWRLPCTPVASQTTAGLKLTAAHYPLVCFLFNFRFIVPAVAELVV